MAKIIITERQYKKLLREYYNPNKLYSYNYIKGINFPYNIRVLVKDLEKIDCVDKNGNRHICVKIPEVMYHYISGRY